MSSRYKPEMEQMLPDEVMFNILSRLPVKTIIWCKCVSKKWRNLVSESYFVDLHLSRSPQGLLIKHCTKSDHILPPEARKGLLKWVNADEYEFDSRCLLQDDPLKTLDLNLAPFFDNKDIKPLGSVHGLIFLHEKVVSRFTTKFNIYICNPVTREYVILPEPKMGRADFTVLSHGFGVSVSGEYKVVRIGRRTTLPNPIEIEVLTLGTDKWINCGEVPNRVMGDYWDRFGVFLNGYLHWVVDGELYAFDLENVTFQLFPTPPRYKEQRYTYFESLDVLGGYLSCLLCSEDGLKVWAMKEHGSNGFWQEMATIRLPDECKLKSGGWVSFCFVMSLNGKSVMLLEKGSRDQLGMYCLETGTIESKTMPAVFDVNVIGYSPSFRKLENFGSERVHVYVF